MKINLAKIPTDGLNIDEDVVLDKDIYSHTDVLDIEKMHIKGTITYDYEENLVLDLNVEGQFLLKDAVTLEPITYPFTCKIEDKIEDVALRCGDFFEKNKNLLDISEILWENIVLEIPISVTHANTSDRLLHGDGWELKNENVKKIDPRLAKLTELLENGKE